MSSTWTSGVHSPFARDDATVLASGMALQMDIIPVSAGPFCCLNGEDGVVLADAALRDTLAVATPPRGHGSKPVAPS